MRVSKRKTRLCELIFDLKSSDGYLYEYGQFGIITAFAEKGTSQDGGRITFAGAILAVVYF